LTNDIDRSRRFVNTVQQTFSNHAAGAGTDLSTRGLKTQFQKLMLYQMTTCLMISPLKLLLPLAFPLLSWATSLKSNPASG
jgi:hypothetical protein